MKLKTIKDVSFKNKAVIVRVDYNVSLKRENGKIEVVDDTRIRQSLATLKYILKQNPKRIVLISHLGRPDGEVVEKLSLLPIAKHLEKLIKHKVYLEKKYKTDAAIANINKFKKGELILLENIRFNKGEETNDPRFAAKLALLGNIFVNDAFGSSHRAHASVVGIAEKLPSVAGLLLERELKMIDKVIEKPKHPLVAVIGGAKATTKIPMIEKLMNMADYVLLGGGVANTFLKAMGYHIGRSVYSPESLGIAQNLIWRASRNKTNLFLPSDVAVGSFSSGKKYQAVAIENIPSQLMALDLGSDSIKDYVEAIGKAATIIWNGPMGANEIPVFATATEAVYQAIINNKGVVSVVGGGDTLTSIKGHDHLEKITHISTGGGAMLEYIEKGTLPGVEVLT